MITEPMTLNICDLSFSVVLLEHECFNARNAVHVILELEPEGRFAVVDVGESDAAGVSSINTAMRREIWLKRAKSENLWVGTYLVPVEILFGRAKNVSESHARIAQQVRKEYRLPRE